MKKVTGILAILCYGNAMAQVHVNPNSNIYVYDEVLFVKQDISLENNSALFLRDESQLVQGTSGNSTNSGLGKLSVYQEGTSDNYDYNYWCSPVGNTGASSGNEAFGISMLYSPQTLSASTAATLLPNTAHDGIAAPLSIAPRWVFKYTNSNTYSQWTAVNTATTIAPGEGFTMKGTSGTDLTTVNGVENNPGSAQRYDFKGKPNDGNISVAVGLNNMTLTGNPYPSALHVNAFLLDPANTACDGIAYYWEQDKTTNSHYLEQYRGGYGTYSPISLASNGIYVPATFNAYDGNGNLNTVGTSSGLVVGRKYAPIGQGFMIKGTANGTVTLKNAHRNYYKESNSLSDFERHAEFRQRPETLQNPVVSHIRINTVLNNQFSRQLVLALVPYATDGIDRGIDAKSPADDLPNDVYFLLDNQKFVIEGIPFGIDKHIPLGVKATDNATFKFYIPEVIAFNQDQPIFIHDLLDDTYHNIKTGYYEVTLDAGIYENRFEITFTENPSTTPRFTAGNVTIFQDNALQLLKIGNLQTVAIKSCSLYDMSGKLLMGKTLGEATAYEFSTMGISEGIYVVTVLTAGGQQYSEKITVHKK